MADLCPECGANPCYRICPTQDPYGGDQAAEAADHDFNAQYDDVRERYMEHCPRHGAYAGDCGGCNDEHYAAEDAESPEGFRPNDDGTVTYISPTGGEHTYDPDQAFPRELADDEPTDAEVRRARQSNIDHGRTTRLHPLGDDSIPF